MWICSQIQMEYSQMYSQKDQEVLDSEIKKIKGKNLFAK